MVAVDYTFVVYTLTYILPHKYYIIMDTQWKQQIWYEKNWKGNPNSNHLTAAG
jgi:hypothetical protein